jgi:hypothetical protein
MKTQLTSVIAAVVPSVYFADVVADLVEGKVDHARGVSKLIDDDSTSKVKFKANVVGSIKAITSTNQCLSYLRRAPTVYAIDICQLCTRVQAAAALGVAGDNRRDNTTEEGTRCIALEPNRHSRRYGVGPRWPDSR